MPPQFAELTSPGAAELMGPGRVAVLLLPVGAVEPHGPHAPLGTDFIISRSVCDRAVAQLSGDPQLRLAVLPSIDYGVTRYAAAFPGALGVSEGTLHALVVDVCRAARAQGFHDVCIVNSHFEPEHVAALRRAAADAGAGLLDVTRRALAERLTAEFRSGAAHAGRYETSMILAARPDLVDTTAMSGLGPLAVDMPRAMVAGRHDFVSMGMHQAYCGAPAESTAAEGEATLDILASMLIELIRSRNG